MISKKDWIFIVVANLVGLLVAIPSVIFKWGWISATVMVALELVLLVWYCATHHERLLLKLLCFGLVAGFVELINDTWLIQAKEVLVYYPGGPRIIDTPLYMPFSWGLAFVTSGAIALTLYRKIGHWKSILAVAVMSGLYMPFYEGMAAGAQWWYYKDVPAIGPVPWFVILGEALLALVLPWIAFQLTKRTMRWAVIFGVFEGIFIWITTEIAIRLVG